MARRFSRCYEQNVLRKYAADSSGFCGWAVRNRRKELGYASGIVRLAPGCCVSTATISTSSFSPSPVVLVAGVETAAMAVDEALLLLPDFAESQLATTSDQPTLSGVFCSPCCFAVASGILPLEVDLRPLLVLGLLLDLYPKRRSPQAPSLDLYLDLDLDVG
ncbi:hypothetical protein MRX96_040065 [Rhipicephalus microplus]